MRRMKAAFLCMVLIIVFGITSQPIAQETKEITCTGKVVDEQGNPITGTRVRLYQVTYDYSANTAESGLTGEVTTTNGEFSFKTIVKAGSNINGYIVAEKKGLAWGWAEWDMRDDQQQDITLSKPKELSGMVVDEAGKPVPDADVGIWLIAIGEGQDQQSLGRPVAEKLLTVTTDALGRFEFTNIPAEATADFIIRKAGKATINTYRSTGYANQRMTFAPGQADIKLLLQTEARIEGTVIIKETGIPIEGTKLIVKTQENRPLFGQEPVISKEDGTFSIDALETGDYLVQLVQPREETAEWVAESINITLEKGQTMEDIKIELCKGGLMEVLVTEAETNKFLANASVSIRDQKNNQWLSARSNKEGIARIRLMSGTYQLSGIYMHSYKREELQETFTIEEGRIKHLNYQLTSQPKINGVVYDENGMPVKDVILTICPMGGRNEIKSDADGKFEISWDPGMWGMDNRETVYCLVARHEKRNLATALEIRDEMKELDIRLQTGVTFTGRIVDPNGEGISGAQVRAMLRLSNWGSPLSREQVETDNSGNYEIRAIPAGRNYNIYASANGYGQKDIEAHTDNAVDDHLSIETLTLPPANLSVSGKIVDAQGNPLPDVRVSGSGEDQPNPNTLTNEHGDFTLKGLCEGTVYIRVDVNQGGKSLSARVHTDAGASGISIVVREGRPASYYIRAKTYEQVVQNREKVIAGIALDEKGSPVAGVPVGVCCIKREREPGKFSWTYSSYSTLSDITDEKGRFAIELEEEAEYNLLFSPINHAAIIVYDVPSGTIDLKVKLPEGGTVIGRLVRMEKGEKVPIPHTEVKIQQTDRASYTHLGFDRDRTTLTDSDGRFRFEHIRTKVRADDSRSEKKWEHVPRVWEISYGNTSKTLAFYDSTTIEDFELLVKPSLTELQSLVGSAIPGFDGIKIDIPVHQNKDKAMLICIFDMNQRPSRNCLRQLSKRAQELKAKDTVVVAIQSSKTDDEMLNRWIMDQGISFPVGIVKVDEEEIRFTWGIKSLPWLILTDRDHKVQAEGFALSELDQKVHTITNEEEKKP